MKEYETRSAARAIADLTTRNKALGEGLTARRIEESWMDLFGSTGRRYTVRLLFRRGVLSVEVSNDAWKNELLLSRSSLRERLNDRLGTATICDIRIV